MLCCSSVAVYHSVLRRDAYSSVTELIVNHSTCKLWCVPDSTKPKWLTNFRSTSLKFSGESAGCGEHGKSFLFGVKRYFAVTGLPVSSWGVMSAHFLKGAALCTVMEA
ncbi:TPA: hypothetical protein ACH3X1_014371 [Trebouxia sp. C0004]